MIVSEMLQRYQFLNRFVRKESSQSPHQHRKQNSPEQLDSFYSVHEVNIGMTADVGTLQRLPKLMPEGLIKELAYTGRKFSGVEAKEFGLVNNVFQDKASLQEHVRDIANQIITKSPIAPPKSLDAVDDFVPS